jgi:hypothetical protein
MHRQKAVRCFPGATFADVPCCFLPIHLANTHLRGVISVCRSLLLLVSDASDTGTTLEGSVLVDVKRKQTRVRALVFLKLRYGQTNVRPGFRATELVRERSCLFGLHSSLDARTPPPLAPAPRRLLAPRRLACRFARPCMDPRHPSNACMHVSGCMLAGLISRWYIAASGLLPPWRRLQSCNVPSDLPAHTAEWLHCAMHSSWLHQACNAGRLRFGPCALPAGNGALGVRPAADALITVEPICHLAGRLSSHWRWMFWPCILYITPGACATLYCYKLRPEGKGSKHSPRKVVTAHRVRPSPCCSCSSTGAFEVACSAFECTQPMLYM